MRSQGYCSVLLMVDFYCPSIDYLQGTVSFTRQLTRNLLSFQRVTEPTKVRQGQKPPMLDYIFTTERSSNRWSQCYCSSREEWPRCSKTGLTSVGNSHQAEYRKEATYELTWTTRLSGCKELSAFNWDTTLQGGSANQNVVHAQGSSDERHETLCSPEEWLLEKNTSLAIKENYQTHGLSLTQIIANEIRYVDAMTLSLLTCMIVILILLTYWIKRSNARRSTLYLQICNNCLFVCCLTAHQHYLGH